jgi:2-(1,2-epoxy-1,2-dihydrophenyl)acetyl-CoA isomerase
MTCMGDPVLIEREGAVARLILNRPDAGNAIDVALARALHEAAIAIDIDQTIRCLIIRGAGRMFCAGGDVRALHAAGDRLPALLTEITSHLHAAYVRLARLSKPVIVAVHGAAAGAGVGLACIGDIVLATREASFTLAYPAIGLSPDGGASWLLPRLIGMRRTQEWFLSNRRMPAEEAAAIGLITRVVADALDDEVGTLAQSLASAATGAAGVTKRLLLEACQTGLEAQLEAEALAITVQSRTAEAREGLGALAGKRLANFA